MSEKIEKFLKTLTLEEIEELKILASQQSKNKELPSYSFSKIDFDILDQLFDIQKVFNQKEKFNNWLLESEKITTSDEKKTFLKELITKESDFLSIYNEEDLKIYFLAPILNSVNFKIPEKRIRAFYEYSFVYSNSKGQIKGTVDFVVAKGDNRPKKPLFFVQEFKKSVDGSNPEPQLLAELVTAIELNKWQEIKGAFIIGAIWYFVILEKLDTDKYQYYVSRPYNSVVISDLELIFKALLFVKQEIINLNKTEKNL